MITAAELRALSLFEKVAEPELERLVAVMSTLRAQCPWDSQQTHRSLVPYLVEETCEVVEAVEGLPGETVGGAGPAAAHLQEELGDLLLQVVFHAELASEAADGFDLDDVAGLGPQRDDGRGDVGGPQVGRVGGDLLGDDGPHRAQVLGDGRASQEHGQAAPRVQQADDGGRAATPEAVGRAGGQERHEAAIAHAEGEGDGIA